MKKKVIDITDVLEVYFFGLSLLVGSEQFYTLVSQTKASPEFQWYLFLVVVFGTLLVILILPNDHFGDFIYLSQLYYVVPLVILVVFVWVKVTSVLVTTSVTIGISIFTTFLVIEACVHYSYSTELVLTFLAGLLSARILPGLCWVLTQGEDNESQFRKMWLTLAVARLSFCLLSLSIMAMKGKYPVLKTFNFSKLDNIYGSLVEDFKQLYEHYSKRFNSSKCISDKCNFNKCTNFCLELSIVRHIFPIICFYLSFILFLPLTPVIQVSGGKKTYFNYAPHMITSLTRTDSFSHFCGFCVGIIYPVTITHRGTDYYFMNLIVYIPYLMIVGYLRYFGRSFSQYGIYLIIMVLAFGLGYNCSYNLGVIINTNLIQNCDNKGTPLNSCCGDKFLTECYCRYPVIINKTNKCFYSRSSFYTSRPHAAIVETNKEEELIINIPPLTQCRLFNRFACSKSFSEGNSLDYSPLEPNGILLVQKDIGTSVSEIRRQIGCEGNCCAEQCKNDKCGFFTLAGIYEIETVTATTCDECQLTVRIEAKNCNPCTSCGGDTGGSCTCSSGTGTNCCCICVKCCPETTCDKCVKLCCCKNCKKDKIKNGARVFMCYKSNGVYCVREITPNNRPKFDEKLDKQNDFYIKSMFISDCCHSDIQVDLHCKLNNNFFRVTEIKYAKKPTIPTSILLCRKESKCCTQQASRAGTQTCCCSKLPIQRVLIGYPEEQISKPSCPCPETCKNCPCCQNSNQGKQCCCCTGAELEISTENLYEKKMKPIKLKLITIFWILFALILAVMYLAASKDKVGDIKYYNFNPVTSHKIITKNTIKNSLNTADEVKRRIDWFLMTSGLDNDRYNEDLKHMLKLFDCTLDPREFTFLKQNLDEVSSNLLRDPLFILRAKIELVTWSCCLGFVYTYIIEMFVRIQAYFIKWEPLWRREYYNYRQLISKNINNITYGSKFAVAASNELEIGFKTRLLISRSRKETWASAFDKVENYLDLYDKEIELPEEQLPKTIEERLQYFIRIWDDRIVHLEEWTSSSTNVFDWDTFLIQYPDIRTWVNMFWRYIRLVSKEFDLKHKKFNKGIEIFENYKIN
ncbi:putative integral membrane protein [Theileria parva strain Muguga]|uniref:Uncharacterized protein n=1 Tax=Theileria parva TaxID=5875 RepID=Q4N4P7_THEPA|nr:putative integral membrane protein [Theileria parva strain Muguga]EAN32876.1 putative integral membrane protein [Theileria parva strain Muguga]|eukprot:XP_765159.1 hypothetical protein [Theileria parva strain Muguga]